MIVMENLADNYYEFIGVQRDASADDIRKACNKLLMKYHPDICKADFANGITTHINKIKSILIDSNERAVYDKTLPSISQRSTTKTSKTVEPLDLSGYSQVRYNDLSKWAKSQYRKFKSENEPGYRIFSGRSYKYIILCTGRSHYQIYKKRESVFDTKRT